MKEQVFTRTNVTIVFLGSLFFLILSVVSVFNTYGIIELETEIQELKISLEKLRQKQDKPTFMLRENTGSFEKKQNETPGFIGRKNSTINTENNRHYIVKKSASSSMESYVNDNNERHMNSEFPLIQDEGILTNNRHRMQLLDERYPKTGRIKPLPSIHFGGDTSMYILGTHENFNGNGHLRHLNSIFVDWKPSKWVESTGMNNHFQFDDGYLTIKEPGLYLVYSQIYYLDDHDLNGYRVFKNDEMILQCTVQVHSGIRLRKGNTCYTAGVEYLAERDRISLGDISQDHYSIFLPGMSFFGVVKLGDIRARV